MSDPFVAEIRMFAGNFAPKGWATCDGQLLPISQNTALFSLLGTFYGGDGKSTFALPNLEGSLAVARHRDAMQHARARLIPGNGAHAAKVVGAVTDITEQVRSQERIAAMNATLRELSRKLLRSQDEGRVAPGGDEILALLAEGPNLILLDETLQYLISAGGIKIEQTTLRDETLTFLLDVRGRFQLVVHENREVGEVGNPACERR